MFTEINDGSQSLRAETFGKCHQGDCVNGICECYEGWKGKYCDSCNGRILLTENEGL